MTDEQLKDAWKRARENRAVLKACPVHRFVRGERPHDRWTCSNCGGTVTRAEVAGYLDGLRTALTDPEAARAVLAATEAA